MAVAEGPDCMTVSLFPSASLSTSEMCYFTEHRLSTVRYGLSLHAGPLRTHKSNSRERGRRQEQLQSVDSLRGRQTDGEFQKLPVQTACDRDNVWNLECRTQGWKEAGSC